MLAHFEIISSPTNTTFCQNDGARESQIKLQTPFLKIINPYWQIVENSSGNFSEIFIFRAGTQAVLLENSSMKNHVYHFFQIWSVTQTV